MKGKRGVATFRKTTMLEKLIKHRGPLKESTTDTRTAVGIGRPPTQDRRW
jgi:hypothetical protein